MIKNAFLFFLLISIPAVSAAQQLSPSQMADDPPLVINEIMTKGNAGTPDFIELFNKLNTTYVLKKGQWYITSTPGKEINYYMLPEISIPAKGFLLIQCDGTGIGTHANFKLGRKDSVALYFKDYKGKYRLMDTRTWAVHTQGRSKGLFPDGSDKWVADDTLKPTPGKGNDRIGSGFSLADVIKIPKNISKLIFGSLLVAVLGAIIALVYRFTYTGKDFNPSFMQAFFLIAVLLGFIMQIIGNSLARAFGMMGAVSIARFRTKVEDAKDTSFVLFAIGVGMACGLGHYVLAIYMTGFTSIMAIVFYLIRRHITPPQSDILKSLTVEVADFNNSKPALEKALEKSHIHFELINIEQSGNMMLTYNIRFRSKTGTTDLVTALENSLGDNLIAFRWGSPLKNHGSKLFSS